MTVRNSHKNGGNEGIGMRKLIVLVLCVSACGYHSRDNEMIGQVKKVIHRTPLICPDRWDVDISLGVIRNGVGSMSSQDMWLTVSDPSAIATLKAANESGALVKVKYDELRVALCPWEEQVTGVELSK